MRSAIYDILIAGMTAAWYRRVLERLQPGTHVLDVGVGTGRALIANLNLLVDRDLRITGIDIDRDYVATAARAVVAAGLDRYIEVRLESIYDHCGGPYDAIYFSASFMLLPDPARALRHVTSLLKDDGRIYFTQTFENRRSRVMERIKPLLRLLTSIDFGAVSYEGTFVAQLETGGLEIVDAATIGSRGNRSFKLFVTRPCRTASSGDRPPAPDQVKGRDAAAERGETSV